MASSTNKTEDDIKSNITQMLDAYTKFHMLLTNSSWAKTNKVEDIKNVFKLGTFVENCCKHLLSQNALEEFLDLWRKQNQFAKTDNIEYICGCDYLLKIFLRSENISELTLDIVIRVYTSMFPKERLQQVLCDIIISSNNLECLSQFINVLPKEHIKEFEYHLHLSHWNNLRKNKINTINNDINEMLSSYTLENNLTNLLGVLSLKNISEEEKVMQNLICDIILEKMLDRCLLSNQFWYTLFQKISLDTIYLVSENFKNFLDSLFSFIIYLGSMMDNVFGLWVSSPDKSICPDIQYYDLIVIIKGFYKANSNVVLYKLNEAKEATGSAIWDEIKEDIVQITVNY